MTEYEVERRVNRNLKPRFPADAKHRGTYEIDDVYFSLDPLERFRSVRKVVPDGGTAILYTKKERVGNEYRETEMPKSPEELVEMFEGERALLRVSGRRESYISDSLGATLCADSDITVNGNNTGDWTEVEVMVAEEDEMPEALARVESAFGQMGVSREELVVDPYPVLFARYVDPRPVEALKV